MVPLGQDVPGRTVTGNKRETKLGLNLEQKQAVVAEVAKPQMRQMHQVYLPYFAAEDSKRNGVKILCFATAGRRRSQGRRREM